VVIDVLPQVELIIGPQAAVPELPPAEARNRSLMVFQRFIGVFAQEAHPLTLFLDDLQWADAASLRLLGRMLKPSERRFLLVVGAYRDDEIANAGPQHALTQAMSDMRHHGVDITQIALAPLSEAVISTFLGEMLHREPGETAPLAQLIFQKTAGNPFFMIQFISALAEQQMIAFDAPSRTWRWDLERIGAQGYTDNVADLMVDKLRRLPAAALAALQRLACLGSGAPESLLAMVCGKPEAEMRGTLSKALDAGLVMQFPDGTIRFLHDRVQEAAYLSISASDRPAVHLEIGRLLLAGKT
jgi:predicted ATPase